MDLLLKFSSELLVVALVVVVAGLNLFYFAGGSALAFSDQSMAGIFLSHHYSFNPKLYDKNSSIITVVSASSIFPQAQADAFAGGNILDAQNPGNTDNSDGSLSADQNSIEAPNPDSIKTAVANVVRKVYTTQNGDSLKSIAAANGISINSIKWSNPQLASDQIKPGWFLIIPPTDGVAVTADANTTLPDLAAKYNPQKYNSDKKVRDAAAAQLLETIISYNGLDSAEDINDGDFIFIPSGVVTSPPAPKPTPKPSKKAKLLTMGLIP